MLVALAIVVLLPLIWMTEMMGMINGVMGGNDGRRHDGWGFVWMIPLTC
jgi:hypothetical protein